MRARVLVVTLAIASGCAPERVYVYPDGKPAPPPAAAASPPVEAGPSAGETALAVVGAVLTGAANGLAAPARHDKMQAWLNANAASIATCLHGTASSSGAYEILTEDASTTKARIKWSGFLGAEHYTDVLITVGGDYSHPIATVAVVYDEGNFSPDDSCTYLRGAPM